MDLKSYRMCVFRGTKREGYMEVLENLKHALRAVTIIGLTNRECCTYVLVSSLHYKLCYHCRVSREFMIPLVSCTRRGH